MAQRLVGVDLGTTGIRGIQIKMNKGIPVITHAAEIPLPQGIIINGELREPGVMANALKLLWKAGKFSTKNVAIGVANQQTLVRQVDLPYEEGEDFKDTLPFKVSQDLPVDVSELSLDYYPLGDFIDSAGNIKRKTLLVGAMNALVENYTQAVTEAKLKAISVDFSGFSLIRSAVYAAGDPTNIPSSPKPDEEYACEVIVDVGTNQTIIAIHHNGRPLFVRLTQGGGDAVTRAISDHLGFRWEVADALKKTLGISGVGGQTDKALSKLVAEVPRESIPVAQQITNMMASSLVQAVRESTEYFLAASPQVTEVSRVFLSGGGSMLPGFGERVAAELRTQVGILAPVGKFSNPKKADNFKGFDPRYNTAFGLCLEAE